MNILLIQPEKLPGLRDTRGSIPLSLLYLAAALRDSGRVPHILDFSAIDVPEGEEPRRAFLGNICKSKIEEIGATLVGINCFTTMHFPLVDELAKLIKKSNPEVGICIGGAHPTYFGDDILLHNKDIDYVIVGEGEDAIIQLTDVIASEDTPHANETAMSNIPALIYRDKSGNVLKNQRRSYTKSIEDFKMPAWDLVDLTNYYGNYETYYNPKNLDFHLTAPIITSRSCPFSCTFCSAHLIMGNVYREKTAVQVVDEIEYLHRERGQNYFAFMDDVINLKKKHVIGMCDEITKRNLNIQISINQGLYLATVEKEVVDALADVGLVTVSLPIEHGDENIRTKVLKKRLKDEKIYEVVEWIKNRDIFTVGLFIMGFPEETEETLEKTRQFIFDLDLDINGVSTLIPFPKTVVHDQAVRDGLLLIDTGEVWEGKEYFDPSNRDRFFIKPYNASLEVLQKYRDIFDSMYFYSERAKKLNNLEYDCQASTSQCLS